MKNLTKIQWQLAELLKAGLWGKEADATLFGADTDWAMLMKLAGMHACMGIAYEGMLTLPVRLQPGRTMFLQWSSVVAGIEEENEFLDRGVHDVFALYRDNGLMPVLLKGQGVAQSYRHPLRRQSGDVDVYVGGCDFRKANALLRKEATGESEANSRHSVIHWQGIVVENHRIPTNLSSPLAKRYFHRLLDGCRLGGLRTVLIDGKSIPVLPLEPDITYLLVHAVLHLLNEGVGLRQVCDWCCMLHAHKDELDKSLLMTHLKGVGLLEAARAFGSISVRFLGLPADCLPFLLSDEDDRLGEEVLQEILEGGNFGMYHSFRKEHPKRFWSGKWHTFTHICSRHRKFKQLAPDEARWRPLHLVAESLGRMMKKILPS